MTGGQFVNLSAVDAGVKAEVEVVQRTRFTEVGRFVATGDSPLVAHVDLILEDEFEELSIRKAIGFGFLQAQLQAVKQPRKPQGAGMLFEGVDHGGGMDFGFVVG